METLSTQYSLAWSAAADSEELLVWSDANVNLCPLTITVLHEQSINLAIGDFAHYDVYDSDQQVLPAEAREILIAVLEGRVREKIWRKKNGDVVAVTVTMEDDDRKVHWSHGIHPKFLAETSTIDYSAYPTW